MPNILHNSLSGDTLHPPFHYIQTSDPGTVGAGKFWCDITTAPFPIYRRNTGNTAWELVGGSIDAPVGATYVTLTTNATLTSERVLTGTANQIAITDNGAGSTVVLSTPQNIHTGATPTFAGLTLSGAATIDPGTTPALAIHLDMAQPSSNGFRDSHQLRWTGTSYDGSGHTIDWEAFADLTDNAGSSNWTVRNRFDGGSWTNCIIVSNANRLGCGGNLSPAAALHVGVGTPAWATLPGAVICLGSTDTYLEISNQTQTLFLGCDSSGTGIVGTGSNHELELRVNNTEYARLTAGKFKVKAGGSSSRACVGGSLFDHYADVATTNVDGTEDDLYSDTTPASCLGTNGDVLEQMEYFSLVSSSTASRRVRRYFAGTLIWDSGTLTLNAGGEFVLHTLIIRETSTVVRCTVTAFSTSASTIPYATYTRITGLTLSSVNILKTTGVAAGVGAAGGDITEKIGKTEWKSAA